MRASVLVPGFVLAGALQVLGAVEAPSGFVSRVGDQSVVLHWNRNGETNLTGYRVYRAWSSDGPFDAQNTLLLTSPSFCDLNVTNGVPGFYRVTARIRTGEESPPSPVLTATPRPFANNDEFLNYVQQTAFDYFWYEANPGNGMVPDRSTASSPCSIAAVGFGLTAIGIGIDHGWITRDQGRERVLTTLKTFWEKPQGTNRTGVIGHNGWFYHFLDMRTALRYTTFDTELSSIDTALLLAGVLYAKQYFDGSHADEVAIRELAGALYGRVDWNWMSAGTDVLRMGWKPNSGFLTSTWVGYNEAMILYCLGIGAATNPLPASSWDRWTRNYSWGTNYNQAYVPFPPLFGHQYSHCWIDFRHIADAYMNAKSSTYFENSRRATLAQRAYCIENPRGWTGYSSNVWGLTASDEPNGYAAHGAPPAENDNGTIAPTAVGGSVPFAPEVCIPTLRHFYDRYRRNIWTGYGFRDAFNLRANWWATDVLGIDQGPMVIMIENYRSQRVWRLFLRNEEVRRGLQKAGFVSLAFADPSLRVPPGEDAVELAWDGTAGRTYQVEHSPDLESWFYSPGGQLTTTGTSADWTDDGPPATPVQPLSAQKRFYRVLQFGPP